MYYFKHISASADDPDIADSIVLFKSDGYYVFFRTLEVMSREFDVTNPGINRFSVGFFRKKFTVSWRKTIKILQFFDKRDRIKISFYEDDGLPMIELKCLKLKDLCDEYTHKKIKSLSGHCTDTEPPLESESESELELENKETSLYPCGSEVYKRHPALKILHDTPCMRAVTLEQFIIAKQARSKDMDYIKATNEVCRRAELEMNIDSPARFLDWQWSYWEKDHIKDIRAREKESRAIQKEIDAMAETIRELPGDENKEQLIRMTADFERQFGAAALMEARERAKGTQATGNGAKER